MTQENKELLLKDLSCRIPYGVIVNVNGVFDSKLTSVSWYDEVSVEDSVGLYHISEVKPYLFPLSSMTEEQEKEFNDLNCYELDIFPHTEKALDYVIKNHFDYRFLIDEGLAIDATGLNIYWLWLS